LDGNSGNEGAEHELGLSFVYNDPDPITVSWDNTGWDSLMTSCVLQDAFGGAMVNVDMLSESSVTLDNTAFTQLKLLVTPSATGLGSTLELEDGVTLVPESFGLSQAYPNPFNPSTEIGYSVSESGVVELLVYDVLGRKISTLVSGYHEPNRYRVVWDGRNSHGVQVPAGVYFYRMNTKSFSDVKKVILLK